MSDLIDRMAAINMRFSRAYDDGCMLHVPYREVISNLKNLPSAQEWIPVSERLPEKNTEVLVTVETVNGLCIENAMIYLGQWETIYDRYERDVYGRDRNAKVIAWQPLPEPYGGGE